jgi:hypothetical protein
MKPRRHVLVSLEFNFPNVVMLFESWAVLNGFYYEQTPRHSEFILYCTSGYGFWICLFAIWTPFSLLMYVVFQTSYSIGMFFELLFKILFVFWVLHNEQKKANRQIEQLIWLEAALYRESKEEDSRMLLRGMLQKELFRTLMFPDNYVERRLQNFQRRASPERHRPNNSPVRLRQIRDVSNSPIQLF